MVYRVVIDDGNAWSMNVVDARPSRLASVESDGVKSVMAELSSLLADEIRRRKE